MYSGYTSTGSNYYYTTGGQKLTNPYGGDTAYSGAQPSSASGQPGFWSGIGNSLANILNPVGAVADALGGSTGGVNGAASTVSNPYSSILLLAVIAVVAVLILERR